MKRTPVRSNSASTISIILGSLSQDGVDLTEAGDGNGGVPVDPDGVEVELVNVIGDEPSI